MLKLILILILTHTQIWSMAARLKDIARLDGVRKNQLVGTGIVIGLNGTGDKTPITKEMLGNTMRNLGMQLANLNIQPKNAAAVVITAELGPFLNPGDTIDITVSTVGDAGSLQGGVLLQTPLMGADGQVYAVAQGAVSVGGMAQGGGRGQGGHQTVGRIPNGAIVELALPMPFMKDRQIQYVLLNGDFATANQLAESINLRYNQILAQATDSRRVNIRVPYSFQNNPVDFISQLEGMEITVDQMAKVVVNERTGTVILGGEVKVSPIAIAHKSMMIQVGNQLNQTGAPESMVEMKNGSTVSELVNTLNLMGIKTSDLIAILQEIKNSGALQAHLEVI